MEESKESKTVARDRTGLLFSLIAFILAVFMLLYIPTGPLKSYRASATALAGLRSELKVMQASLDSEKNRLQSQEEVMRLLKERNPSFNLYTFLNGILAELNLSERARLENYRQSRLERRGAESDDVAFVQLQLTKVYLDELVSMLHKIYSSKNLVVLYRMEHLRPAKDNDGLECSITFLTPKPSA